MSPRAEFEVLRNYLEWRIWSTTGVRGQPAIKTQTEVSRESGLSIGKISDICNRTDARGLATKWPEVVAWIGRDIEGALAEARKWRMTSDYTSWMAGAKRHHLPQKVIEAIHILESEAFKVTVDAAVLSELRRYDAREPDLKARHLASRIQDWIDEHKAGEDPNSATMLALTKRDSSRPPSARDLRKPMRK